MNPEERVLSVSPSGESFTLPMPKNYPEEFERLKKVVQVQRDIGREIVVVMGLGFVGAVMAGVVADAVDKSVGERENDDGPIRTNFQNFHTVHDTGEGLEAAATLRRVYF